MTPISASTALTAYVAVAGTVILAGWCRFKINERRFLRRTIAGGQRFPSYGVAVVTRAWEGTAMIAANIVLVFAVFCGLWVTAALYMGH